MKRTQNGIGTKLDQLLARHRNPASERMQAAIDRVGRQIGSAEIPGPVPSALRRKPQIRGVLLTAASMLVAVVGIAMFWPERTNPLYRVVEGAVVEGNVIQSNAAGAVLALADESRIEMRSNSALSLERADDGIRIHLNDGGI